ncbi:hypothetical protein FHW37_104605 [Neorhizobium alkalisoli]|uniref:Uncharacterized protein n=1 Tax=Neorhizobium alkalisoli TaxID=528178 RepID=A0A561QSR3_9HYPH|nr:hypothetical protein FHW37_104605 [Neorhizobium alkalisoli]
MKVWLISLAAAGVTAGWLLHEHRQPAVDSWPLTGTVSARDPEFSDPALRDGKTQRLSSPSGNVGEVSQPLPAPLVVAQSMTTAPSANQNSQPAQPGTAEPSRLTTIAQALVTPQVPADPDAPVVDESALRYFAARGDAARLQAEISRLRALYPTWTPPADPLAVRANGDPQLENMWQLYAQSRYEDLRKAIAQRQATEPAWQVPQDLLDRLKLAEARSSLTASSDRKDYEAVIRTAAENPSLLTCAETDVLWRVAEAFADTDKKGRARDAYAYVLDNCDSPAERVATVQKASELLPPDMLDTLLAKERTPPGGQPEFETLRDDLARRFVADGNTDPKLVVPDKYLTRLEQLADKQDKASDALLLGWYYYRRDNLGGAERWFRRAHSKEDTASSSEGLALTLIKQNSPGEAENVLYRWRDTSDGTKAAYMASVANLLAQDPPPVIQETVLARMAPIVIAARDAAAAQQFGWYARAMRQPATAAEWFGAALNWKRDDEPSAYGLALSRNDLGDRAGLANLQRTWGQSSERIAEIGRPLNAAAGQPAARGARQPAEVPVQYRPTAQQVPDRAPSYTSPAYQQPAYQQQNYQQAYQQPAYQQQPVERAPRQQQVAAAPAPSRVQRPAPARASAPRGCAVDADLRGGTPEQSLSRGWCLMDLNRPLEAVQAFEAASASSSQVTRSDAAYGRSLAYLRVGLTDNASAAAAAAKQPNTRAVELQSAILSNRAVNAFKLGHYNQALIALDQRAQIVPEQNDLLLLRGYSYLNVGRRPDAVRIFQALASTGSADGQRALADLIYPPEN